MDEDYKQRFPPVPDEVRDERRRVAERVCAELRRAGLPAILDISSSDDLSDGGAVVEVFDDEGPDMYVSWHVSKELEWAWLGSAERDGDDTEATGRKLAEIMESGEVPPIMRHSALVKESMMNTVVGILVSAGLHAKPANNEYWSYVVQVACR